MFIGHFPRNGSPGTEHTYFSLLTNFSPVSAYFVSNFSPATCACKRKKGKTKNTRAANTFRRRFDLSRSCSLAIINSFQ